MTSQQRILMGFVSLLLVTTAFAEPADTNRTLSMALTLTDGSRVVGIPKIAAIPVQTSFAKMDIPLAQIRSIKVDTNHEAAAFALVNGDKLNGTVQLKPIELQTLFGKAAIDLKFTSEIAVYQAGKQGTLRDGLVLYYAFDKDEGDKVTDESGEGHDGTVKNAKWTSEGKAGGAYSFDGSSSYIRALGYKGVTGTTNFTISMWVKRASTSEQDIFMGWGSITHNHGGNFVVLVGYNPASDNKICMNMYYAGCNSATGGAGSVKPYVADNEWHHLAFILDGTTFSVYQDGQFGERWDVGLHNIYPDTDLVIGVCNYDYAQEKLRGLADEVRLYNRALSDEEVKALYDIQR